MAAEREAATMVRLAKWSALRVMPAAQVVTGPLWTQPGREAPIALLVAEKG